MDKVLEIEKNRADNGLGELTTFIGLPSKSSSRELSGDAEDLFRKIVSVLNNLLLRAIDAQTGEEFVSARSEIFLDVTKTHRAMGNLARVIVDQRTLDRLVWQSFSEMQAELTEHGIKKFGMAARDQAVFTVWTLRKINRLLSKYIVGKKAAPDLAERDREIARDFAFYASWTQFHLECLIASMRFNKPIQPKVLEEICDGLRASVNAYGLLRQGLDLRSPSGDEDCLSLQEWDEEDQELLDSSMADMEEMEVEDR